MYEAAARAVGIVAAVIGAAWCGSAGAAPKIAEAEAYRVSQAAVGRVIGGHEFVSAGNQPVRLEDYRGEPLVISLVYTGCTDVCPIVSAAVAEAIEVAGDALGEGSFRAVTIGFDARNDTPRRMRAFARRQGLRASNWQFLSSDGDTIDRLAADLGFMFYAAPQGFDHVSQTTILDAEGRVYRQIYGADFEPQQLVEPLKLLVFGRSSELTSWSGLVNQVRLVCTIYDPASGKYRFDYSIFAMIAGGVLSLGAIAVVLVREWLRNRRLNHA